MVGKVLCLLHRRRQGPKWFVRRSGFSHLRVGEPGLQLLSVGAVFSSWGIDLRVHMVVAKKVMSHMKVLRECSSR